jgi:hypothetical protein
MTTNRSIRKGLSRVFIDAYQAVEYDIVASGSAADRHVLWERLDDLRAAVWPLIAARDGSRASRGT